MTDGGHIRIETRAGSALVPSRDAKPLYHAAAGRGAHGTWIRERLLLPAPDVVHAARRMRSA
jgi:hypothetical protein